MAVGIPNFPTSLDAASDLVEATNNASTTINMVGGLSNSATTITVVSTAAFPSTGIIRIDDELISYSAKTSTAFTVQTRGFESTTAASHIDGATVSLDITAASNNAKNTAIIALETKVGTGSSTPTANTVLRGTGTGTTAFGQVGLTTDVTGTLPAANGGTGITSLGANVATFLGTPSSANLASAVTDETGSGALVFGTSPTLTTPNLGTPSAVTLTNATGLPLSGLPSQAASTLLGRGSSSTGSPEVISLGTGLTMSGTTLSVSSSTEGSSNRNRLINGDFTIAQRGTSFTSSTLPANNDAAYHLDRWYILSDGNNVVDISRSTDAPTGQLYSCALDVTTINKKFGIAQVIEQKNCVDLIGNNVSLSFKAKVSSTTNLTNIKAAILSWSGTADTLSTSRDVVSAWNTGGTTPEFGVTNVTLENTPANLSVTTSWATYKVENVAIDTANTKNIIVFIWSDVLVTAGTDILYITDVQLEAGTVATSFKRMLYQDSLNQCQFYLQLLSNKAQGSTHAIGAWGGRNNSSTQGFIDTYLRWNIPMRVTPTLILNGATHLNSNGQPGNSDNTYGLYNFVSGVWVTTSITQGLVLVTASPLAGQLRFGEHGTTNDMTGGAGNICALLFGGACNIYVEAEL